MSLVISLELIKDIMCSAHHRSEGVDVIITGVVAETTITEITGVDVIIPGVAAITTKRNIRRHYWKGRRIMA